MAGDVHESHECEHCIQFGHGVLTHPRLALQVLTEPGKQFQEATAKVWYLIQIPELTAQLPPPRLLGFHSPILPDLPAHAAACMAWRFRLDKLSAA